MATMEDIAKVTRKYADAREVLSKTVRDLNDEVERIKRKYLPQIKKAAANTAREKSLLHNIIADNSTLFAKPRTQLLHGIKVGYQKGKGKLIWKSEQRVIKLIKKNFRGQAELLIKTEEKPVKAALEKLPAEDLKKLGIEVLDAGDQVVIKTTDSDIDKLVNALLKDGEADGE